MNTSLSNIKNFEQIFKDYYEPLVNFVNSRIHNIENSEEIVQDTFTKLWENREKLNIKTSLKSYLYQATRNSMIDFIRKSKNDASSLPEHMEFVDFEDKKVDVYLIRAKIEEALDTLKPKNKEIFMLNKFEGLTYKEIADYLNMSERGIEDNIARANKQLKKYLEKENLIENLWILLLVASSI